MIYIINEKGSIPNMSNIVNLQSLTPEPKAHSFVDTITDKLHQLRHDDKSKSGNFLLIKTIAWDFFLSCIYYNNIGFSMTF